MGLRSLLSLPFTRLAPRSVSHSDAAAQEFDRLLREHVPVLYRNAYRWTGTAEQAEDLVQELLVRLYPRLAELRELDRVRPWALRVMYRIFVDQTRRTRNSPVQLAEDLWPPEPDKPSATDAFADEHSEPSVLLEQHLTQERLLAAWQYLGEEHRTVLAMHDIEGYSLVEIAAMTGVPIGTLKSRLHRARARLRGLLTERSVPLDRVSDRHLRE